MAPGAQASVNEKCAQFGHVQRLEAQRQSACANTPSSKHVPFRRFLFAILLVCGLWLLVRHVSIDQSYHRLGEIQQGVPCPDHKDSRIDAEVDPVPLEAHIMSKCPDARDCLQKLVVPAMIEVSDKVNFTLSYIGKVDEESDQVSCMHGPGECLGNIIQLCAARVYPKPKIYLGFVNCMTSDYQNVPDRDLVEGCAMEHGIDFQKLNSCISDEGEGIDLLRSSVERSREYNVTKSCTIRLGGKVRCVRDGGEWYDCPGSSNVSSLVSDIKELYGHQN